MSSLYVLSSEYRMLAERLADSDFDAQTVADTIEASGLTDELTVKAQNIEYIARGALSHNDAIDADAEIDCNKLCQERIFRYNQVTGTNVVANAGEGIYISPAVGQVISVEAMVTGTAATGDRSISIDVKKGNTANAYATVLSAPIVLDIGNALRTLEAAAVAANTISVGDSLLMTVAVGGSTGTQPQGLLVTIKTREAPGA